MALVATLDRSRSTHLRILEVKQLLYDISSSNDQTSRNSFDEAVYSHILKKLNSAIMRSPQGEEACSELLKIVDKLEERLFGEVEQGDGGELGYEGTECDDYRRRTAAYSGVRPVFGACDCCQGEFDEPSWQSSEGDFRGVFSQQHPTSPVSGQYQSSRSAQSSLSVSSSTEEFNSPLQDSFHTPEASVAGRCPLNSDPPRKSEISSIGCNGKSHDDLDSGSFVFGRTARKLEISFMECTKPSGVLRKLAAVGRRSTSARDLRHSLLNSWGSAKSIDSTGSSLNASKACRTTRLQKGVHGQRHSPFKAEAGLVPEIACQPLMLVSKASRHRLPGVESKFEPQSTVPHPPKQRNNTSMANTFNQVVNGSLQCVLRDGLVTYNLWLDETEELLVAKPVVQDYSEDQEVYDKVFSIFSHKFRGRGRAGWVHWGRKDKPVVEMLGKLKVLSTVIPEMDLGGKHRHFVDTDFVLLEARPQTKTISSPFSSSGRKVSFSSWDAITTTPSESPRCMSSSSESPMFGLPQPSPRKTGEKPKTPVKWPSMSFLRPRNDPVDYQDAVVPDSPSPNFVEVAAMVTRIPVELKKSTQSKVQDRQHQMKDTWESRLKRNNRSSKDSSKLPEDMNVTVVLPAGDHGCPAHGFAGPQPLLDRWRSGGNCDCGSWDLGCGLLVLANQQSTPCSAKAAQEQAGCVNILVQGKRQDAALKLSPLFDDDTYRLSFQQPLSALQAIGTAVAVLHSSRTKDRTSVVDDAIAQPRQAAAAALEEEAVSTLTRHRRSRNNRSRG